MSLFSKSYIVLPFTVFAIISELMFEISGNTITPTKKEIPRVFDALNLVAIGIYSGKLIFGYKFKPRPETENRDSVFFFLTQSNASAREPARDLK